MDKSLLSVGGSVLSVVVERIKSINEYLKVNAFEKGLSILESILADERLKEFVIKFCNSIFRNDNFKASTIKFTDTVVSACIDLQKEKLVGMIVNKWILGTVVMGCCGFVLFRNIQKQDKKLELESERQKNKNLKLKLKLKNRELKLEKQKTKNLESEVEIKNTELESVRQELESVRQKLELEKQKTKELGIKKIELESERQKKIEKPSSSVQVTSPTDDYWINDNDTEGMTGYRE